MVQISDFVIYRHVHEPLLMLLYVGPDQALPLLSALGAIIGVLLMWWRRLAILTRRALKSLSRKDQVPSKTSE